MKTFGQGATEYLVLLAVVLIVALVSVALLGFFPGMASDAQLTQTKSYWASAQPISIVEMDAKIDSWNGASITIPYLRVRNSGAYPIRITKILGAGSSINGTYISGAVLMYDYYYMAPGEEKYFAAGTSPWGGWNVPATRYIAITALAGVSDAYDLNAASTLCQNATSPGTLVVNNFGFEYIEYLDNGQQLTKREIGAKPLVIKCTS